MPAARKAKVEEKAPAEGLKVEEEEVKVEVAEEKPVVKKAPAKKPPVRVPAPKSVLVRVIGKAGVIVGGYYLYPGESRLVHWATYLVAHNASPGRIQVRTEPKGDWHGSPPNKYIQ